MWKSSGSLIYKLGDRNPNAKQIKIASFDLDSTIVETQSGKIFPDTADDWQLLFKTIRPKFAKLVKNGYTIVIFTNQAGIQKKKVTESQVKERVTHILQNLGVFDNTFVLMASRSDNHFRKPCTGMWDFLESQIFLDKDIDYSKSFYVGDAAGRKKNWKPHTKKDFSCSDRKFAHNVGIIFFTPEEYFMNLPPTNGKLWDWQTFDSKLYLENVASDLTFDSSKIPNDNNTRYMYFMVAPPASGKSTFTKQYLSSCVRINRDTLKTKNNCLKETIKALDSKQNIVIDNTNPNAESRKPYVDLAMKHGYKCVAIVWMIDKKLANHLNYYRVEYSNGKSKTIPMVVYHVWYKKFEMPTNAEGFDSTIETTFIPRFENDLQKTCFLHKY